MNARVAPPPQSAAPLAREGEAAPPALGVVMLVHEALGRAAQVARHWARHGCPVVIHVDRRISDEGLLRFRARLAEFPAIRLAPRRRCEWGTWSLVAATQDAVAMLLEGDECPGHVLLASGSCLPLRPVAELQDLLRAHPQTDFIESVTTQDVTWTVGGLEHERFTLRFPFAWRRQRWLFDAWVRVQRRLRLTRSPPAGLVPHLGSQWWCLSRATLEAIAADPRRAEFEQYFRRVWIPDESYYQSLARLHGRRIESRSLTLSKFDFQGRPHVFYDDHLQLLRRSDCFLARKIWPQADGLYRAFLGPAAQPAGTRPPQPGRIDRVFALAHERRTRGRRGLVMQSRYPRDAVERNRTAAPYLVVQGFGSLYQGFDAWLSGRARLTLHGHLFAPERAGFAGGQDAYAGALPDLARRRDYDPQAFLRALLWNTRGEMQAFHFGPGDRQPIAVHLADDPNAHLAVIAGAWVVPLWRSSRPFAERRREAALLQQAEAAQLERLRRLSTRAQVRIWTLAEAMAAPAEPLRILLDELLPARVLREAAVPAGLPPLIDLKELGGFLQELRNQGMEPHVTGDFPAAFAPAHPAPTAPPRFYRPEGG